MTPQELQSILQQQLSQQGVMNVADPQLDSINGPYLPLFDQLGIDTTLALQANGNAWTVQGNTVSLQGTTLSTLTLGLQNVPIYISYTGSGNNYTLLMDLALPANWTFGTSFALLQTPLYDGLKLVDAGQHPDQSSSLIVASAATTDPQHAPGGQAINVPQSLSFYGFIDYTQGAIAQILWLITGNQSAAVQGPIEYNAATTAVDMALPLAGGQLPNILNTDTTLTLSIDLYSGLNTVINLYESGLKLSTTIDFGSASLLFSALLPNDSNGIMNLQVTGQTLAIPDTSVLSQFFGNSNPLGNLPNGIDPTQDLTIGTIQFGIGLSTQSLMYAVAEFNALQGTTWNVWPDVLSIGGLTFTLNVMDPLGSNMSVTFNFNGVIAFGGVQIAVGGQVPLAGDEEVPLLLSGEMINEEPPDLVPFVQQVFGYSNNLPQSLSISELRFDADATNQTFEGALSIIGDWSFAFGSGDNQIRFEELDLSFAFDANGSPVATGTLGSRFVINTNVFEVVFTMTENNVVFDGVWETTGSPLDYQDIAVALGIYGLPEIPEQLDLNLQRAEFIFDSAAPTFSFTIDSLSYGQATLIAGKGPNAQGQQEWGFVFGLEMGLNIDMDLTNIDVVGNLVPSNYDTLSLNSFRMVGATQTLPSLALTQEQVNILGPNVNSGLVLSLNLSVGEAFTQEFTVRFGGQDDGSRWDVPPASPPQTVFPPNPTVNQQDTSQGQLSSGSAQSLSGQPSLPGPEANWVDIQRSFGPVTFRRAGFNVNTDNSLSLFLDAGVSLAGLSIDLIGLEADINLNTLTLPGFGLGGLQVDFSGGPLNVAGGLLKVANPQQGPLPPGVSGQVTTLYTGDLTITFESFGASIFGSYTQTSSGAPSLFAFLFLGVPLGGPAFMFVTGLAGGLGYNSNLQLPTIENLSNYPLIKAVTQPTQEATLLQDLNTYITPQDNQNWVAAGLRFTSFEMLNTFVLATASFGAQFELALMGDATLKLPVSIPGEDLSTVAEAEMVLLASFAPSQGVLTVEAQLTSNSYVLSKDAHLTGGFAFYLWFDPNDHAGDFVISLGGYNPYFNAPSYYPTVPRLGLNWRLSSEMSIKGGLYFALTPSVIMAGGSLEASWQSGGIRAWFTASADFLIRFKPFYYQANLRVTVGASFTLDLWFTKKSYTISTGVDLDLWGPDFGGRAEIDVSLISFTIEFGARKSSTPPNLDWTAFRQSFLPAIVVNENGTTVNTEIPGATTTTNTYVTASVPAGLLSTLQSGTWVVDPAHFELVVATLMPNKSGTVTTAAGNTDFTGSANTNFGIGPMGLAPNKVSTGLTVTLTRSNNPDDNDWQQEAVYSNVPKGLWLNTSNTPQQQGMVQEVLTGVSLMPDPPAPEQTVAVLLDELTSQSGSPDRTWQWTTPTLPTQSFDQSNTLNTLATTLNAPQDGTQARTNVLDALRAQGLSTAASVNVSAYAQQVNQLLPAGPVLAELGQEQNL